MGVPFENIVIERNKGVQSLLNIENKTRSNIFSWNGQFSPQFIESLLQMYAQEDDVVFDPFLGSGTTLGEAERQNISAFGIELNASAYFMAKTYEGATYTLVERSTFVSAIDNILSRIEDDNEIISVLQNSIEKNAGTAVANVLSTLIILMDIYNHEITIAYMHQKWKDLKKIILELPYTKKKIRAYMGDARSVPVENDVATLLITSPPYINVFNYHQKYRRSVEALGYDVLSIARKEFGSNRKNRGNRLLTVIQYCIDMALSFQESIRICKDGSRMVYVVGRESNVLGYSFCNSQLIYEIGTEIFRLKFLVRQERAFKNRFGKMIYEDILHFSNKKKYMDCYTVAEISDKARAIAVKMLESKLRAYPESDNAKFLYEAIKNSENVRKSED